MKNNSISNIIEEHIEVIKLCRGMEELIESIAIDLIECLKNDGKLIFFGNGGSAADSQHLAAEFIGRFQKERKPLAAISLTTDTSIITSISNDYSYDSVFKRQLMGIASSKDIIVAISTSGNSISVIEAVKEANRIGAKTIALTGETGGDLQKYANKILRVPSSNTARVQECHILLGHILCQIVEDSFSGE